MSSFLGAYFLGKDSLAPSPRKIARTLMSISLACAWIKFMLRGARSKSFATQYDAQMTQAKFLCYYST